MVKYLVEGGWVTSRNDGQTHFVSADEVIRLYGVPKKECLLFHNRHGYEEEFLDGLIYLYPQISGNYNLKDRYGNTN